ncbi:MAG TPA: hypothetical protein VK433_08135 [Stellaceae bacterium]|nr:hypothetical protein [Stellaceae bacterium]
MSRASAIRPLLILLLLALGACNQPPPPRPALGDLHFTSEPPIELDVRRIEIVPRFRPGADTAHIEERPPLALPHVAENWARDRLRAAGTQGVAVATITDASVIETKLPTDQSLSGMFTRQRDTRYDASVAITVEVRDDRGAVVRQAMASAQRSITTIEGITLDERDRTLYQLETDLMSDLDRELDRQIRDRFGYYVR